MKIGVDARLLSRPLTGIGRYTLEMCRALSKEPNVSLYLYSPGSIQPDVALSFPSAHIRTKNWNNGLLRQLWGESYLPLWAKKDEVDVFWGPAHRLPRCLPSKMARVVTIHDLVWKFAGNTMRPLTRLLERYQMPFAVCAADAVVADSKATADAIKEEFFINSKKLSVIHLGASTSECISSGAVLQQKSINRPYFLFVGTLEPRKNLISLLTAYSLLFESIKDQAMLVIVGGKGWGGIDLNNTISDLGLKNYTRVLGYVDEAMLATLYANALFLAMPSLYEGFGLPIVEAIAHGTPVLTSDNSSMPEVAGSAGLLVDPLAIHSIKNGLEKLITNRELLEKLARNTKENATRFSWTTAAKELIFVFEKVVSARKYY